jgi:hypothetical protein
MASHEFWDAVLKTLLWPLKWKAWSWELFYSNLMKNKTGFRPVSWQQQGYCFILNAEKCPKHWESMLKTDKCCKNRLNIEKICQSVPKHEKVY